MLRRVKINNKMSSTVQHVSWAYTYYDCAEIMLGVSYKTHLNMLLKNFIIDSTKYLQGNGL